MSELDAQFRQAVATYKTGDKDQARDLLLDIVDKDERHEQAWLYLSALVGSLEEQQICLENVLAISPDNQRAKKGLEKVNQQLAARDGGPTGSGAVPASESPPTAPPQPDQDSASPFSSLAWDSMPSPSPDRGETGGSAPIGAEFGGASGDSLMESDASIGFPSFDSLGVSDSTPEASDDGSMDWLDNAPEPQAPPEPEPLDSPSSVDWGGGDDAPPAYGSGKQVDLPSESQYDDWVQGLNIGTGDDPGVGEPEPLNFDAAPSPEQPDSFSMDREGPFGETAYMLDDDTESAPTDGSYGDQQPESAPQENVYETDGAYEEAEPTFGAAVMYDVDAPDASSSDELDDLNFSFEDDDNFDGFGEPSAASAGAVAAAAPSPHARYFAMIPEEIQAKGGGGARRGMMFLGFILLLALNAVSFAMLLI